MKTTEVSDAAVDVLMEFLLKKFKPKRLLKKVHTAEFTIFSKGRPSGRVNAMISAIDDFDIQDMVKLVEKRKAAS